ncbi:hypothetical protein CXZ10_05430 [Pleomorphomonas diazotrophica]|uniref:Uncharacterized protein n=1 Tax=Pleomorphomonas diazotrophica TaxID=1166257 RepID=A0A1I4QB84_9HYPH|nr:DUF2585 family protein [Pleomorphomonas diazotrophica]PKR90795.1 hypothetical protein CXZ10_05430 [Pleomorphomonas diazotrophica]SFM37361.1 Protein of unknown function [Pleomorphomonas diazotrophica]
MVQTTRVVVMIIAAALIVQAAVLYAMGQPSICACGTVRLWAGTVLGPENSQQITDWYTPSHVIHGILFFALGRLLFRRWTSPLFALALALGIEVAWELIENSPPVIARYREQALAQGYSGDSILNSLSDTLAMLAGFWIAARLPVRASIALALAAELFTGLMIRDNLTLNVVQLLAPNKAISAWQAEGGVYGATSQD